MGTVKSYLFNFLVPPSFDKRKKAETNYIHCKALQLASLYTISVQADKIEILFLTILTFSSVMYLVYEKILFLESSSSKLYIICSSFKSLKFFPEPLRSSLSVSSVLPFVIFLILRYIKIMVAVKVHTKLFNLWPLRHFFGFISNFLPMLISKRYPFSSTICCKARKRQLQTIGGNMIETEDVIRDC